MTKPFQTSHAWSLAITLVRGPTFWNLLEVDCDLPSDLIGSVMRNILESRMFPEN